MKIHVRMNFGLSTLTLQEVTTKRKTLNNWIRYPVEFPSSPLVFSELIYLNLGNMWARKVRFRGQQIVLFGSSTISVYSSNVPPKRNFNGKKWMDKVKMNFYFHFESSSENLHQLITERNLLESSLKSLLEKTLNLQQNSPTISRHCSGRTNSTGLTTT